MKNFILIKNTFYSKITLFILIIGCFQLSLAQPCLNPWNYRVPITVNNTGASLTNHQVSFSLNTLNLVSTGKMLATGGDIRVTNSAGTAIPFWIENGTMNTSQTVIWTKVPTISNGNNTIYLFYGNPSATLASNGGATFNNFDDFLGTLIDPAVWSTCISGGGSITVNGGIATITSPDASNTSITSVSTFAASNSILEMKVNSYFENTSGQAYLGEFLSSLNGYGMKIKESGTGLILESSKLTPSSCAVTNTAFGSSTGTSALGIWNFQWITAGSINGISPSTSISNPDNTFVPGTVKAIIGQSGATGNFSIDWFRSRSYASAQPICTVGSEATLSPPSITATNTGPICSTNGTFQLNTTSVTGATYSWVGPAGFTSTLQNPILTSSTSSNSGVYTITTSLGPCASSVASTTVTVNDATVGGTVATIPSVCSSSNSGTLTLSGNTGSVISWESASSVFGPFATINNTTTSLSFGNLTSTTVFRAVIKNGVCAQDFSSPSTVTVDSPSDGGTLSGATSVCETNPSTTLSVMNAIGTVQKWQVSFNNGAFTDIVNSNATFTHSDPIVGTYKYRVIVKNSSCTEDTSSTATIVVNQSSNAGSISGSTTVCANTNSGSLVVSGNNGNILRWESSFNNNLPWTTITNTSSTLNFTNLNQTVYYRVIVQNPGCSEIASASAPVNVNPITNAGTVIGGINVCASLNQGTLTLTGNSGSVLKWQVSNDAGLSYNDIAPLNTSNSLTFTNLSAGTYLYRCEVQSGNCPSAFSVPASITVYPLPVVNFLSNSVCQGAPTVFTNNSTIASGSISAFNWDFDNGSTSTATIPNYTFPASGNYNVRLRAMSNYGCMDSVTVATLVKAKPVVNFSQSNVCLNTAMNFSSFGSTLASGNLTAYDWNFGDGNSASGSTTSHSYSLDGSYSAKLVLTSDLGCKDSLTKTVIVYPLPVTDFSNNNACLGNVTNFVNNSNISSGNLSYIWDFGDGTFSSSINSTKIYLTPITYNVELTATSNFGCTTSLIQPVIVNPLPDPSFSVIETCPGSPSGFANTSTIVSGTISGYNWDFGDGTQSNVQSPLKTYTSAGTFTVSLTATSSEGCLNSISQPVTVTIGNVSGNVRGNILGSTNVCVGNNGGSLLLTGQTGSILQWEYQDAGNNTWTVVANTSTTLSYSNLLVSRIYRVLTQFSPCSTDYSDTATITVNNLPLVDFNAANVCKGQSSQFINNSSVPSGNIQSSTWDFGDGGSSVLAQPLYTYSNDGTFSVLLTVTSTAGCTDTLRKNVIVNPVPLVNFTFTNRCLYDSVHFINNSTLNSGTIIQTQWNFGDNTNSLNSNPSHLYSNDGNFDVQLILTTDQACTDSLVKSVTIYPLPITQFSFDTVCYGNQTSFTNSSSISSGNLSYSWDFGDGANSNLIDPSHLYASLDTFQVNLISSSTFGCKDTVVNSIIVNNQPIANFTVQDECLYDSAFFVNTSISGAELLNFNWNFGDGSLANNENPIHIYPSAGIFNVALTVSSPSGCSSNVSKSLTIYEVPTANFSVNEVCDSLPSLFVNLSSIGTGLLNYVWSFGDGNSSVAENPSYTYSASAVYSVQLIAASAFGCTDTLVGTAIVNPRPNVNFYIPPVCEGDLSVFSDSSTINSGSIISYQWNFGDGTNSIVQNPSKQYLNTGVYPVTLLVNSDKGCSNDTTINAIVNLLPVADFNFLSECDGDSISYFNLSSIGNGIITPTWSFGDGNSSSETSPKHLFSNAGDFITELLVVSNEGCKDSISKTISVFPIPQPDAGKDTSVSQGYAAQLNATGGESYFWFPTNGLSSSSIPNPKASPFTSTSYTLTVIDVNGCIGYDTVNINIIEDYKIIANNIITPNGDGVNEVWQIENITTFENSELIIFDRWGKIIYKKQGYDNSWNGTSGTDILPDGTYYYIITFETSEKVYKGSITLLRDK